MSPECVLSLSSQLQVRSLQGLVLATTLKMSPLTDVESDV